MRIFLSTDRRVRSRVIFGLVGVAPFASTYPVAFLPVPKTTCRLNECPVEFGTRVPGQRDITPVILRR